MKKLIAILMTLIVMVSTSTAAFAAKNESMKDYERVLLGFGFVQDESDDTVWYFDGVENGYQVKAFYDAYYDSGVVYAVDLETGDIYMDSIKWQPSELEFESIAEFEFIQ